MARTKGAVADKFWSEAVRLSVYREDADNEGQIRKRLNIIADKLCRMAMDGDMAAIKEIGERLDGKAPQGVDVTSEGEALSLLIRIGGDDAQR
jgi:hypothetical protein